MSSESREGKDAPDPYDVPLIISVDDHVREPPVRGVRGGRCQLGRERK